MLKYLGYTVFIPCWYLLKLFPRDENIWVFGSWFGDLFSDNPKALFEYSLNQKNDNIKCVWLTNNIHSFMSITSIIFFLHLMFLIKNYLKLSM